MADLDPARRGLVVGEGRGSDRGQLPEEAVTVGRDRAKPGSVVRVADKELEWSGGRELGAELTETLPGEGRTRRGDQPATGQHQEAVDLRSASASTDEAVADRIEKHIAQARAVRYGDR